MVDRFEWLEEIVRQSERQVDLQLDGLSQLDDKLFRLIRLSSLLLAGGLTLGGYYVQLSPDHSKGLWLIFGGILALGIGLTVVAMVLLTRGYTGGSRSEEAGQIYLGPDPGDLNDYLPVDEQDYADFLEWILEGYGENIPTNRIKMEQKFEARRKGFVVLILAVGLLGVALAFLAVKTFNIA